MSDIRTRSFVAVIAAMLLSLGGVVAAAPSLESIDLAGTCCWNAAR